MGLAGSIIVGIIALIVIVAIIIFLIQLLAPIIIGLIVLAIIVGTGYWIYQKTKTAWTSYGYTVKSSKQNKNCLPHNSNPIYQIQNIMLFWIVLVYMCYCSGLYSLAISLWIEMSYFLSGIFHFNMSMFTRDTVVTSRVGETACWIARSRLAVMMMCACLRKNALHFFIYVVIVSIYTLSTSLF